MATLPIPGSHRMLYYRQSSVPREGPDELGGSILSIAVGRCRAPADVVRGMAVGW